MNDRWRIILCSAIAMCLALDQATRTRAEGEAHERKMVQRLVLKPGKGKPLKVHPTNDKIRVDRGRLIGPDGKSLATLVQGQDEEVGCFAFSPDGRFLVVGIRYDSLQGGNDGTIRGYVRLYSTKNGRLLWDSGADVIGPVVHIAFSTDGKTALYRCGKYEARGGW
jgi:hypothetical protein